ncbi:MAG: hypothetical protein IKZ44_09270 [Clostridia bacterium]|nr:hypothetical protein [Clostridia bacterium]
MNPQGKPFLIISIILCVLGLVLLIAKSVAPGIICLVIGAVGTLLHFKNKNQQGK